MSTICTSTPTLTQTNVVQTGALITTFTNAVTNGPGSVSTSFIATCIPVEPDSPTCRNSTITSVISIPGPAITTRIPIVITSDGSLTQTTVLYGQTCSVVQGPVTPDPVTPGPVTPVVPRPVTPGPVTPGPTTPSPVTPDPVPPVTVTRTPIRTQTPTPVIVTVVVTGPSTTYTSTQVSGTIAAAQSTETGSSEKKAFPIGPVVGGVVGGLVVIAGLAYLAYLFFLKPTAAGKLGGKPGKTNQQSSRPEDVAHHLEHGPPPEISEPSQYVNQSALQNPQFNQGQGQSQGQGQGQGQATQNDVGQLDNSYEATGGESQAHQNSNPFQDAQNAYQDYQDHKLHRLPGRLEQRLAEQFDEHLNMSQLPGASPFAGGLPAGAGATAAALTAMAGYQQGYAPSPSSSPSPPPPPGAFLPTHGSQPSFGDSTASFGQPQTQGWQPPSPPHPAGQYNVAVPSQVSFPGQQAPGQVTYAPHLASQYKGYAEPSRGLD